MQAQVLNIKTSSKLFPICYALVSIEGKNGEETLYTFKFNKSEYEECIEDCTTNLIQQIKQKSITYKEEVIQYFNDKIQEIGVFDFMSDYNLVLYKDPTSLLCKGDFANSAWFEFNQLLKVSIEEHLFVVKEEFEENVIFLYS